MVSFNDFTHKNNLKMKATSLVKMQHVISRLALNVKKELGDGTVTFDEGKGNLHPKKNVLCCIH